MTRRFDTTRSKACGSTVARRSSGTSIVSVGAAVEDGARQLYEPGTNVDCGRRQPDRVGLQPGEVEQAVHQVDESRRLLGEHAPQLAALLVRKLVLALVQRPHRPVDRASRGTQFMRGERDELALQFVEATQLAVLDRLLEETGDQRPERGQQVDLGLVEKKTLRALVAGHEAEAAAVRGERHDHEGPQPEVPRDPLRHRRLGARILDVHGAPRGERPRERAEMPNGKRRRQRPDLIHRQAVACEGHERRRVGQEADDADALKAEAAGNRSTRALEHGPRTELSARKGTGEAVQRLELCGFGWAGHVVVQRDTAAGFRVYGNKQSGLEKAPPLGIL